MVSTKKSFYDIAADFDNVSDEEVEELKCYLIQQTGEHYGWQSSNDIKLNCQKEWTLSTFIEIYVIYQDELIQLSIDRDDCLVFALLYYNF